MKNKLFTTLIIALHSSLIWAQSSPTVFLFKYTEHLKNIRDIAVSNAGDEIYFTHQHPEMKYSTIYIVSKIGDDNWSMPKKAPFSGKHLDMEPFFSPDNLRLYFVSDRQKKGVKSKTKDFDIWYLERKSPADTWSAPINVGEPINTTANEFYPSVSSNGDFYFTSDREGTKGKDDIFFSAFKNGVYEKPVSLSDSINSDGMEFNAYVSPKGNFLIYSCYNREDGFGSGDLYISHRTENNEWSKAKNMGESINSPQMDYCPFVLNGVLYFTSKRAIDELLFLEEQKNFPGGRSRLFSAIISESIKSKK